MSDLEFGIALMIAGGLAIIFAQPIADLFTYFQKRKK